MLFDWKGRSKSIHICSDINIDIQNSRDNVNFLKVTKFNLKKLTLPKTKEEYYFDMETRQIYSASIWSRLLNEEKKKLMTCHSAEAKLFHLRYFRLF